MYLNLERSRESLASRIGDVNQALGLPRNRPLLAMNRRGSSLMDVWDGAMNTIATEGVVLVVLDSLSRGGFGDMNGNDSANEAMDALNRFGTAWLALAHTPYGDEDKIFGSQMFQAAADITVQLKSERRGTTIGLGLEVKKANDVRFPPPQRWAYEFDDAGLTTIREAEMWEFEDVGPAPTLKGRIVKHLEACGEDSATSIASATGIPRRTVAELLSKEPFRFSRKDGKSVLYTVSTDVAVPPRSPRTSPQATSFIEDDVAAERVTKDSATSPRSEEGEPPW